MAIFIGNFYLISTNLLAIYWHGPRRHKKMKACQSISTNLSTNDKIWIVFVKNPKKDRDINFAKERSTGILVKSNQEMITDL